MEKRRINVCGIEFDDVDMNEALDRMAQRIKDNDRSATSQLLVANQDIINKIRKDSEISIDLLNRSFLTIPDGESIIIAGKILGTPLKRRVPGPDLMENFLRISNDSGYKNFFFGSTGDNLSKLIHKLKVKFPDLKISGSYAPPFASKFNDEENMTIINMINTSDSDVVWVSLGCPKQEKWIMSNADKLTAPIVAGVGAAFDFHSGNLKRAPLWIQKIKMEWLHRFLHEPLRLFDRYFFGGILFFMMVFKQKLSAGQRIEKG
jgi:N-acetylglucosaminyldiphosphoundecaprenol N-acetyl-beta-D-mannosaminyltransferase